MKMKYYQLKQIEKYSNKYISFRQSSLTPAPVLCSCKQTMLFIMGKRLQLTLGKPNSAQNNVVVMRQ